MSRPFRTAKRDTIQKIGELRAARFTFREIGAMIGYSAQRAHQIWHEFFDKNQERVVASKNELDCNGGGKVLPEET